MSVCIPFLIGFGQYQGICGLLCCIGEHLQKFGSSRDIIWDSGEGGVWVVWVLSMIQLEWAYACGCIWGIVACKLSGGEKLVPVILVVSYKSTHHVFQCSIGLFSLSICLRMKGGGHCKLGAHGFEEGLPESAGELGILI